ncbi:MAG: M4 family metallopeptidase [Thermoanaerobaculia bacterium]
MTRTSTASSRVARFLTATALAAIVAGAIPPAQAAVAPLDGRSAADISAALQVPVSVSHKRATGAVSFLRVADGVAADLASGSGSRDERARSFFAAQRSLFGIRDVRAELALMGESADTTGQRHLTYRQFYRGLPVYAGILRAHFDAADRLRGVSGTFVPGIQAEVRPAIDAYYASQRAIAFAADRNSRSTAGLSASLPKLEIYRLGLDQGVAGPSQLVWEVEVANGGDIREFVFVDARYGKVLDFLPGVVDAMFRRAFLGFDGNADNVPDAWPASPDWLEGNAIPSGNQERDNMLLSSGDVYTRFMNGFGRDSYDALGHVMDQAYTRNYGCPNASWNGNLISFCPGFTTHDVTAHEWAHAYTEYTHGLIYRWQSGALNEAYSDIWGEAFDLETTLSGMVDTDTPNAGRTAAACSTFTVLPPSVVINAPGSIAGPKLAGTAAFGPQSFSLTNDVVLADDGVLGTGTLSDGCCASPSFVCAPNSWTNAAAVNGKIAIIDRGVCGFAIKVKNAQDQGAIGVIIANNTGGTAIINMSGVDATITIPALSVTQNDGAAIKTELLTTTVNASVSRGATGTDASVRWLMGEDVAGGALRDMWTPTCYTNPGKVTDTLQYVCSTTDNGGVHTNSGIPNHAFALLVDGGTYNSVTVAPIGMVKALHLYYRSQTVYQSVASDFGDHADAMEASCNDFVTAATSLADPWGGPAQVMVAGDCTAVANAMLAVQMRTEPTFCNFVPLLDQSPPALCTSGFAYTTNLFDWESGAAGWTVSRRGVVNPGTFLDRDWAIDGTLPGGRTGSAYWALDPNAGDCVVDDETGALVLDSPTFVMPFGGAVPRLTFDHYVASEATWDGGNVKISVNGGAYTVIPPAAFSYNDQISALSTVGAGNTNPLAGEQAWHGTDGGSNSGSWGRTIGDLTGIVAPGQSFQLRYEFGNDGCGGTDLGWWVDDVQLYTCQAAEPLFIDGFEVSTTARWSATAP